MDQPRPKRQKTEKESDPHTHQLNRSIKRVSKAVKKAKTFELQHVVRQMKKIRDGKIINSGNPKLEKSQLPSLEVDFTDLKAIDPSSLAHQILSIRLAKFPQLIASLLPPKERLTGRAVNKLSSNRQLAKIVKEETAGLRSLLDERSSTSSTEDTSECDSDSSDEEDALKKSVKHSTQKLANKQGSKIQDNTSEDSDSNDELDAERHPPSQPSKSPKSDGKQTSSRPLKDKSRQQPSQVTEADSSESEFWPDWDNVGYDGRPSTSMFLPSLKVGYARGGSGASDDDDPFYERLERERGRKNRRGQHARRAIWEKKYGKNAKHLQKVNAKRNPPSQPTAPVSQPGAPPNPNLAPVGERKAVHPSWEAKAKQQEALAKAVPMGKKIVFD